MATDKPAMKMPELLVFIKFLLAGFLCAEVFWAFFYISSRFAERLSTQHPFWTLLIIFVALILCLAYSIERGSHISAWQMIRSRRADLLISMTIGVWMNWLATPWLEKIHTPLRNADPNWAPAILVLVGTLLASALIHRHLPRSTNIDAQFNFIPDNEIEEESEDELSIRSQAKSFAETVLASTAHSRLVFGVDAPWGTGKTSFINIAQTYWNAANDKVIVCRFEPLRYASEPAIIDRLIRELSAEIQQKTFAPEFLPAANRYSRLVRGQAELSFFGFKISLTPSPSTVEDLLGDIDEVLSRIGRRVIIVIDDLDRLDSGTINNILFATRQTLKLSQATYVLCYDTEILIGKNNEKTKAREFLEKFVTVKLSLFIDSSQIRQFLTKEWQEEGNQPILIPSETMLRLSEINSELANILDSDLAPNYLPILGDLRKVKRFVNTILLMQIEKSDLSRTDFNKRDLINLVLLHLYYPGIFRKIYAEETDNKCGSFSVQRDRDGDKHYKNSQSFEKFLSEADDTSKFLLQQIFAVDVLGFNDGFNIEDELLASRACFNHKRARNLEAYLRLIVRFITPEPQSTFVLYKNAVEQAQSGEPIRSILASDDFKLNRGEYSHDQFWRLFVNRSHNLTSSVASDGIDTLVEYLPRYSAIDGEDRGLRQRSVYSLLRLLDQAGWGRTTARRRANTPENVVEIAWRMFGEGEYANRGLLESLARADRGVLGWNDLMIFRLYCSADRENQLHNLRSALIVYQDLNAKTSGLVSDLALSGMRILSQRVFCLFKQRYIKPRLNFFSEVNKAPKGEFLGEAAQEVAQKPSEEQSILVENRVSTARSVVKSFVIYQLSNAEPAHGSGVGCGYYDESGEGDSKGIFNAMNEYLFDFCFNPKIEEGNSIHFLDYCLSKLSSSFFSGGDEDGYIATKTELVKGIDPNRLGQHWHKHHAVIRKQAEDLSERKVVTSNYEASYREHLKGVFEILDQLSSESSTNQAAIINDQYQRDS